MKTGFLGAAVIALWLVLSASSCADSGSAPGAAGSAAPKTFQVGQTMTNDAKQSVTVNGFKRGVAPANEFLKPSAGDECIGVVLTIVNGDKTAWQSPLIEMTVVDANGQSHNESFTCGNSTSVDALVPNGKAVATLYFEAPTGSALRFTWTPNIFNANSTYQTELK